MARHEVRLDDKGKPHKVTKHQRKSEAQLIGWTPGPQTRSQRVWRNLVG